MRLSELIFFLIGALGIGICDANIVMDIIAVVVIAYDLITYCRNGDKSSLVRAVLVSIISPSNYIVIAVLVVVAILYGKNIKIRKSQWVLVCSVIYVGILTIIRLFIGQQKVLNLVFAILFYMPLLLSDLIFNTFRLDGAEYARIVDFLKKSIIVEWVAIISRAVFHPIVLHGIDFDWVIGTFGISQGNLLFFYGAFCFLIFWNEFTKRKKSFIWALLSVLMCIMTGSIAMTIMFAVAFVTYMLVSKDVSVRTKLITIVIIVSLIVVFIVVTPQWIKNYIVTLVYTDDRSAYITKLDDYARVFISIPQKDLIFLLIGNGLGMYCSRGALTCTGLYIGAYNKFFNLSMSDYTEKYIYDKLVKVYDEGLGSMDTPFSSIMSVFSETGIVGLILLIIYLIERYLNSQYVARIFVLLFALSLLIENYLEFGRVVPLLFLVAVCVEGFQSVERKCS